MGERIGELVDHRYGKAGVRLLRLDRESEPHRLCEATVEITLEGPFSEAYTEGDNRRVLPTDTMKNTVYAKAREHEIETPEGFALLLARHFAASQEQVERATVRVEEAPWRRHGDHAAAFVAGGEERHTAEAVVLSGAAEPRVASLVSGIEGLVILKSSRSGFEDFPRDPYTLLEETDDRVLSTRLEAYWDVADPEIGDDADPAGVRRRVHSALLDAFAEHESRSLQHTLYAMAEAALDAAPETDRIFLRMPNKHYLLARLQPLGLDNPNVVFVPIDEPAGMIEGTVERRRRE